MQIGFAVIEGRTQPDRKIFTIFCINLFTAILGNVLFMSYLLFYSPMSSAQISLANIPTWYWNIVVFHSFMALNISMLVSRVLPRDLASIHHFWIGLVISGVIFAFMERWVWGEVLLLRGYLGFIDFAGASVVHSTAAWIILAAYWVLGRRQLQEVNGQPSILNDSHLLSLGIATFILWLAWSSLNISMITGEYISIQKVVKHTFIAMISTVLAYMFLALLYQKRFDIEELMKAALGALIAISASCALVSGTVAMMIGGGAALIIHLLTPLVNRYIAVRSIGDIVVVHGMCGVWGTLALCGVDENLIAGANQARLMTQLFGVLTIFAWSFGVAYVLFRLLRYFVLAKRAIKNHVMRMR
ncbi:ammonium transporter [Acinetobacter larvae]|nr:ammonium transporter [Acinetobacter larvae]